MTVRMSQEWAKHQTRDEYWRHGSICEDYSRVHIPVLLVGGFADGYTDPVFRMLQSMLISIATSPLTFCSAEPIYCVRRPPQGWQQAGSCSGWSMGPSVARLGISRYVAVAAISAPMTQSRRFTVPYFPFKTSYWLSATLFAVPGSCSERSIQWIRFGAAVAGVRGGA